jgi:hypothetical protein
MSRFLCMIGLHGWERAVVLSWNNSLVKMHCGSCPRVSFWRNGKKTRVV